MGAVERERFVPAEARPLAYVDRAVALGDGRFLPAPAMLGQLLTELLPKRGQRALVVGAGTGYSAAVLAAMGARRDRARMRRLRSPRRRASLALRLVEGPLAEGCGRRLRPTTSS